MSKKDRYNKTWPPGVSCNRGTSFTWKYQVVFIVVRSLQLIQCIQFMARADTKDFNVCHEHGIRDNLCRTPQPGLADRTTQWVE